MNKIKTQITLEPEVKEKIKMILMIQDKKLSTVINSFLKKYVEENNGNKTNIQ